MSTRRLLDVTSQKKRDNMMPQVVNQDNSEEPRGNPVQMTGDNEYGFLFIPSGRDSAWTEGEGKYARQKSQTFCKGYAEKVTFETSNSANWLWRRVVFMTKNPLIHSAFPLNTVTNRTDTDEGYNRVLWNFFGSSTEASEARETLQDCVFQGQAGVDWNDRYTAKLDTKQITVISSVTMRLSGGNDAARIHHAKRWYPINKNIVYDEDEAGNSKEAGREFSTLGKPGAGNLYVMDTFHCANGTSSDVMSFNPQGVYYWHER